MLSQEAGIPPECSHDVKPSPVAAVSTILMESYISAAVLVLLWLMCLGFARSGGVGAMDGKAGGWLCVCGGVSGRMRISTRQNTKQAGSWGLQRAVMQHGLRGEAPPVGATGVAPSLRRRPEYYGSSVAVRARIGGVATQLAYAT